MQLEMPSVKSLKVEDEYSAYLPSPDVEKIRDFMAVCGDVNPIHWNQDYCKLTHFEVPIAHGALLLSLLSCVLGTKYPGPGTVVMSMTSKFTGPLNYTREAGQLKIKLKVLDKKGISATLAYEIGLGRYGGHQLVSGKVIVTNIWDITEKKQNEQKAKAKDGDSEQNPEDPSQEQPGVDAVPEGAGPDSPGGV